MYPGLQIFIKSVCELQTNNIIQIMCQTRQSIFLKMVAVW